MSISRKFAHDDIVRVIETGETGISFHQYKNGFATEYSLAEARPQRPACQRMSLNS
jgi:hypothetical protein